MPRNDRDVFAYLVGNEGSTLQIDYLTFALFAHEKREWIRLYESQHEDQSPSQAEIDNWISNLTDSQFVSMRSSAESFFVEAATAYFEDRLEAEREAILRSTIVSEVRAAGAWWKQVGIALLTTIVSPLIIGVIIAAAYFYDKHMFTPTSIADHFKPAAQENYSPGGASPPISVQH